MKCLNPEKAYLYLEKGLSSSEEREIYLHLRSCPRCQQLLADRAQFMEAIKSLPHLQPPPDFTDRVMEKIINQGVGYKEIIFSVLGLITIVSLSLICLVYLAGTSLLRALSHFYQTLFSSTEALLVILVKMTKIIFLLLKLTLTLAQQGLKILSSLFILGRLELICLAICLLLPVIIIGFFTFRRKMYSGAL
jgi:hypothetical protein